MNPPIYSVVVTEGTVHHWVYIYRYHWAAVLRRLFETRVLGNYASIFVD